MKLIDVHLTEKDKKGRQLTLFNFREELVNFMYKKTVANSSRTSLRFFVLIFFLSLKIREESLLENLLKNNIENLKRLNRAFSAKDRLERGEYSRLVAENGLTEIFRFDIFFILIETILDSERVLKEFDGYFSENSKAKEEFTTVVKKYKKDLEDIDFDFKSNLLADDRIDEFGEYHDLSKSVYRMIKMRTSRQIDLSLHKYAELKIVKSQSPIDLSIVQHIDPQIIFDLWETYKLGEYVQKVWDIANSSIVSNFIGGVLTAKYLHWKTTNGKTHRKEKMKAKQEFETSKKDKQQSQQLIDLVDILAKSVLKSNEYLQDEITALKNERTLVLENRIDSEKEKDRKIKELEARIEKLENIAVETKKKE